MTKQEPDTDKGRDTVRDQMRCPLSIIPSLPLFQYKNVVDYKVLDYFSA